ncbi:LecA/PA-IL family lectin [Nonomuraea fuscirosea]|uniref:LecA/PA-IL family lectin n=1 Tax=Nonomuraea fuscirosea TaxID=1291556 RepID=UPI0033C2C203
MNAYRPGGGSSGEARRTVINVPATQAWTGTGLYIQPGQAIHITANGAVEIAHNDAFAKAPDGDPGCTAQGAWVAPGLPCWSLIGRVGDGSPRAVGQEAHLQGKGDLYLGINDEVATFGDNSGSWTVSIEVD